MPVARLRAPAARRARPPLCVALFALGLGQLAATGCASYGPPEPSLVARGGYFSAGHPDYDEFFVRLFRLQVALGQAPDALARARASLAKRLGIAEKSPASVLHAALAERANELRARGVSVRVESNRETAGEVALKIHGSSNAADAEFLTTCEQSLGEVSRLRQALPGFRKELEALPPRGIVLEAGIETAFVGTGRGKRGEIRENLADAQKIMGLMGPRLKEVEAASDELAGAFVAAFPPPAPPPPPAPVPAESDPKPKAAATGTRPSGAKPAPKPASAGDSSDAPASPKPAQGTAKPDFEP